MRKYLLIVALLTFSIAHAQTWKDVGTPKFSTQVGAGGGASIFSDTNGLPFIAFQDVPLGSKITVQHFNGTSWMAVGSPAFTAGTVDYFTMALDPHGYPYVAFLNRALPPDNVSVMKFDGSSWGYVGPATANGGSFSSIAIAKDGTPYFACIGDLTSSFVGVLKFDGTNWVHVGSPGFSGVDGYCSRLAMGKKDTPYVCYIKDPIPNDIVVMKFDGTNWVPVENVGGAAMGRTSAVAMVTDTNGIPYVAYSDVDNGSKATVKKYVGGKWQNVGTAGFSTGDAELIDMTISKQQNLYVSFSDYTVGKKLTSMTFNNGSWTVIDNAGFSVGKVSYPHIAVDTQGIPYVLYSDLDDAENGYIRRPDLLPITGIDSVCIGLNITQSDVATGGSWTSSNTTKATVNSAGKVTGLDTGSVTITYTVANMPVTHGIKVKDCRLEVSSVGNELSLSVFPNPANDELNITGVDRTMNYRLLNLTGISLLSGELHSASNSIGMTHFPPGVYLLEIVDNNGGRKVMRVVKD